MAAGKPLRSAEMTRMCFIVLLMRTAASVSSQFNGYNCDANYHSRFPGENRPRDNPNTLCHSARRCGTKLQHVVYNTLIRTFSTCQQCKPLMNHLLLVYKWLMNV